MATKNLDSVYDVLVELGGAEEKMRETFKYNMIILDADFWRFNLLGVGGEYDVKNNCVISYSSDVDANIVEAINNRLNS